MGYWWRDLDRIMRGQATRPSAMASGRIEFRVGGVAAALVVLAMVYGLFMGSYAVTRPGGPSYWQLLATTLKVPALFALTLFVTFPSLYVFNALVGSRLSIDAAVRLLIAALAVMIAVLASLGTIVAFFGLSTSSYSFMVLLNVVVFGVSGTFGLTFLLQTLQRLSDAAPTPPKPPPTGRPQIVAARDPADPILLDPVEVPAGVGPGALEPVEGQVFGQHVRLVFRCWVILFGLVGAQMGWILRPFLGDPHSGFVWFRGRDSNFFQDVLVKIASLFS